MRWKSAVAVEDMEGKSLASQVIWNLNKGNKRYLEKWALSEGDSKVLGEVNLIDRFIEDPLRKIDVQAVVCGDAHGKVSIAGVFDAKPGELQVMRSCGAVISANDGLVGSAEYLVETTKPALLLVMGQSRNPTIEAAVAVVLEEAGRGAEVPEDKKLEANDVAHLKLVEIVLRAARDAMIEQPKADFRKLCDLASQLNIWMSVEALLTSSTVIASRVANGEMEVHGAFLRQRTGRVQFLGEHPSQARMLRFNRPSQEIGIRTAEHPPVAAEEALSLLYVGNRRYASGAAGQIQVRDDTIRFKLSESGQNPIAVVVGCADSRAPIEILFDMRPGDLFVLRNAGNVCKTDGCSLIGSAEYAISQLRCKLVVVTGHTQCGAVTAAIDLARQKAGLDAASNIGKVLREIMPSAEKTVELMPDATLAEQVKLATKLNIMETMKKMVENSSIISEGCKHNDLQVHGAVYDLYSGRIEWLGQNTNLEDLVGTKIPTHQWKTQPYVPIMTSVSPGRGSATSEIQKLLEGNERFVYGHSTRYGISHEVNKHPFALLLGAGEVRMPLERIFDVADGSVVVQKTLGGYHNTGENIDTPTASIEFAINRYRPKLIVVIGETGSGIADEALVQVAGAPAPSQAMQGVLNDLLVSAKRATEQVSAKVVQSAAGHERQIKTLTVQMNTWYTIQQLLVSKTIRQAVRDGLEMHGAVLSSRTGEVRFLGEHPCLDEILSQYDD